MSEIVVEQKKSHGKGLVLITVFFLLCVSSPLLMLGTFMPALFAPGVLPAPGGGGPGGLPEGPVPLFVPAEIQYQSRSSAYPFLIAWLNSRNSALADSEHLAAIEAAGQKWNVDPLLLLAITGQEQSFVPKRGNWRAVEKNPWNVFGSWEYWSGGFSLSAQWAAATVARLSRGCPEGTSVIQWVNGFDSSGRRSNPGWGYAGHAEWWRGVSYFYNQLKQVAEGG
ncbi:MAG: hypothetical protein ACOY46_02945 [Bacillota bacterium]